MDSTLALKKNYKIINKLYYITNTAKEDVQSVDSLAVTNVEFCLINYRPNNSPSRHCNLKWVQWHLNYIMWIVSRPCSMILCVYEPRQIEP
jgi:hypothetical protein